MDQCYTSIAPLLVLSTQMNEKECIPEQSLVAAALHWKKNGNNNIVLMLLLPQLPPLATINNIQGDTRSSNPIGQCTDTVIVLWRVETLPLKFEAF